MITITTRQLGRKKPLLEDWSFEWPPDWGDGNEPITLRALITRIVTQEVRQFRNRQKRALQCTGMSAQEIAEAEARGSVKPGTQAPVQEVDEDLAADVALQAFEDGIYLVILDAVEQRDLDSEVYVGQDSTLTFIRLVMLAGA